MSAIGTLVGYILSLFILLLLARMVLDWMRMLSSQSPPWVSRARELAHAGTEPVIAPVRRRLRPVNAGGISLDIAFTVVFIGVLILRSIAFSL